MLLCAPRIVLSTKARCTSGPPAGTRCQWPKSAGPADAL